MFKLIFALLFFSILLFIPAGIENAFAGLPLSCYADTVIAFDPSFSLPAPPPSIFRDPTDALGPPDFGTNMNAVSLNDGGLLVLGFTDNILTNSGDALDDLHIFEIGRDVEHTFVGIRPTAATDALLGPAFDSNGDGFYEIGKALGSTYGIDIDAFFPAAPANTYEFDAVQLIDDALMIPIHVAPATLGADIDAVCAFYEIQALLTAGSGNLPYPDPNLGDIRHGQGHDNGFCMNQNCINVDGLFNHFPETTVPQGSTQTFSVLVNCPRGANTCSHISLAGALPDADFYDDRWSVNLDRQVGSEQWDLTVYNPFEEIGDGVTATVQSVGQSFVTASFNIPFLIPGSVGTHDGVGQPHENNRHLHVTVWDNNRGSSNYIFNDGIYVDDIYAYPQIEVSYEKPLHIEPLCLNENSNKRYTCAFDKVREWTIKNAEATLEEMTNN